MSESPESVGDKDAVAKHPRKRRFDADDGPQSKRNNADEVLFKIMLPSNAVGAIIGKGGEMIAKLQDDNGIKMLVSKVHDTYPGTKERVCRISGPIPGILHVLRSILSHGYSKLEKDEARDIYDNNHYERSKQVKMIIPHSSAGVVIGKAGDGIKEMHESSGAYLDVSKRDREPQLPERVVTYAGEHEQLIACTEQLLERLANDKNATSHQNVSYTDLKHLSLEEARRSGGGSSSVRSGGGLQMRGDHGYGRLAPGWGAPPPLTTDLFGSHAFDRDVMARNAAAETRAVQAHVQSSIAAAAAYRASAAAAVDQVASDPYGTRPTPTASSYSEVPVQILRQASSNGVAGFLSNIGPALRGSGYSESAIAEIRGAMQTLAKHNVLGLGLGFGLASISHSRQPEPSPDPAPRRLSEVRDVIGDTYGSLYSGSSGPLVDSRADAYSSRSIFERNGESRAGERTSDYDYYRTAGALASGGGEIDYEKLTAALRNCAKDTPVPLGVGAETGTVSDSVEVPENLIGVVLGRGGSTLQELQRYSGASMDVSKKGDFAPGTDKRIVKISGTPEAVAVGKRLVERRVVEEKLQREARLAAGQRLGSY